MVVKKITFRALSVDWSVDQSIYLSCIYWQTLSLSTRLHDNMCQVLMLVRSWERAYSRACDFSLLTQHICLYVKRLLFSCQDVLYLGSLKAEGLGLYTPGEQPATNDGQVQVQTPSSKAWRPLLLACGLSCSSLCRTSLAITCFLASKCSPCYFFHTPTGFSWEHILKSFFTLMSSVWSEKIQMADAPQVSLLV